MRLATRLLIVLVAVAALVASLWTADIGQTVGEQKLPRADKVVVFAIPRLAISDVTSGEMPHLERIAAGGAIGAMRVKTPSNIPNVAEAYATLGAGSTVSSGSLGMTAYGAHERILGTTAIESQRLITGHEVSGAVVVPGVPQLVAELKTSDVGVGALGTLLRADGHPTAVVANSSGRTTEGIAIRKAPAALAVADRDGAVSVGSVDPGLLRKDPRAPFGVVARTKGFDDAVRHALREADVVVVDPGETTRAVDYLPNQTPAQAARSRVHALERTDAVLGAVVRHLPPHTLLLVVGMTPGTTRWALTPVIASGEGIRSARLASPSTHRSGLLTLTDLAPTILHTLGVKVPNDVRGSVLRVNPGHASWAPLQRFDRLLDSRTQTTRSMMMVFIVAQAALYLMAILRLSRGRRSRPLRAALEVASLTFAAWPLATFVIRLSPWASSQYEGSIAITWLIAAVVAVSVQGLRRHALDPLLVICGATFAVIATDLATGSHLMLGSFFGYSPSTDGRYFGIDNAVFAILSGCAVVVCAAVVDRAVHVPGTRDRTQTALVVAAVVAAVTIVVDGAPWMGADVGGILTLVPVFGLTLWALAGHKIDRRFLLAALGAGVVVLLAAVGADALRSPDQRTHIGRFFLGAGQGNGQLLTSTLAEKWQKNMRIFGQTPWAWVVPIIAVFAVYVLVVAKGWQRLLPAGSPRRTAIVSGLILGILGWLLNDSGVVVTALVFVYLGPLLLLLELRDPDHQPSTTVEAPAELVEAP